MNAHEESQDHETSALANVAIAPVVPLSASAAGAVAGLLRAAEMFHPAFIERAHLRAGIARALCAELGINARQTSDILAAALLIDVGQLAERSTLGSDQAGSPVINRSLLEQVPTLEPAAELLAEVQRHGANGVSDPAPPHRMNAHVLIGADMLLGRPMPGRLPEWEAAKDRVRRLTNGSLDAAVADAIESVDLVRHDLAHSAAITVACLINAGERNERNPSAPNSADVAAALDDAANSDTVVQLFVEWLDDSIEADAIEIRRFTPAGASNPIDEAGEALRPELGHFLDEYEIGRAHV